MDYIAPRVCVAAFLALQCLPASAESLRCQGHSAEEGDSKVSVLYKCGQPLLKDSYCAPVFHYQTFAPLPEAMALAILPCQPVEEWLYDRGFGNLMAMVRFRSGVVRPIAYGRVPR